VSAAKTPRLGSTGDAAIPGTTRLRSDEETRPARRTTARGFTPQGDDGDDATNDAPATTRRTDDTFRDAENEPDESDRDAGTDARERADDFRDAARETTREGRVDDRFDNRDADRDADRDSDRRFGDRDDQRFSRDRDDRIRGDADFRVDNVRSADIGLWFDRSSDDGLIVNSIGTGVISRWGLREGDRIYSVNGMRVDSERDFVSTLFDPRWRDQRASVSIYRHGRPWPVYMHPSQLVTEYTTVATTDPLEEYGLLLDDRYDDYVVVWRVTPRSPAYYAGLRPGDVITTFDGRRLSGRDDFVRWMGQGNLDNVAMDINRNRQLRRIDFDFSPVGIRTGARTSLRPNLDVRGRFDGNLDGRIDGDARLDGRIEGRTDSGVPDATPNRGTIPNRLRGSAGIEADADMRGTVQPGVQGGIRSGVQGGVRGGGLFRGNR
jgi:hypothetical protein